MILILGKSSLAKVLQKKLLQAVIVGRPEFDLSQKQECDRLVREYRPEIVINTVALNDDHDVWDIMTVNTVSMMYLTIKFYQSPGIQHIINISSTSTYWVSHPDITDTRLAYNFSKQCISDFGRAYNRKIVDTNGARVSTVELGSFSSRFNHYAPGRMTVNQAADTVMTVLDMPLTSVSYIGS